MSGIFNGVRECPHYAVDWIFLSGILSAVKREGDEYQDKKNLAETARFDYAPGSSQLAAEGAS